MTSLVGAKRREARRAGFLWPFPTQDQEFYAYAGTQYFGTSSSGYGGVQQYEAPPAGFKELVAGPFRTNPIVFACELKRLQVFSEARFVWQGYRKGLPGKLFGDESLNILHTPWPRGETGDLLGQMILSVDIGGTAFVYRDSTKVGTSEDRLRVLRPDHVTIVMGDTSGRPVESQQQLDADIIGFIFDPRDGLTEPEALLADEVAVWAPIPDPLARFRGMSWLTPIIREAQADQAASMHKLMFFEHGATPQMVMSFGPDITEPQFRQFVTKMDDRHAGWQNAYRTLYVGGGATPTVVGKDLQQLDFSATQGKGETRICAASGIHPVLVPVSEGLAGSSLNAGNYKAARDSTADMLFHPLWRGAAAALQSVVPPPNSGARLWYDETGISFLRQDAMDVAQIRVSNATAMEMLIRAGYLADSVTAAVLADDLSLLEHSGLYSVQLIPPQTAPLRLPSGGNKPSPEEAGTVPGSLVPVPAGEQAPTAAPSVSATNGKPPK